MSLTFVLVVVAALIGGALIALVPTMVHYRGQLAELADRLEQNERAKVKANEQLIEARAQVESLQKELIEFKRHSVVQSASASSRAAAAAAEAEAARQRARAELVRQLEANDRVSEQHAASEFADTQPLASGFGGMARR